MALALSRAGTTLVAAGRYAEAVDWLGRADDRYRLLGSTNIPVAQRHTRVLNQLADAQR